MTLQDASYSGGAVTQETTMDLAEFKEKLDEYATNNISALMGAIQITQNERDDLMLMYRQLSAEDKRAAAKMLKAKGVDVTE
jgi:hypothetical protein